VLQKGSDVFGRRLFFEFPVKRAMRSFESCPSSRYPHRWNPVIRLAIALSLVPGMALCGGCGSSVRSPLVIFLDGAGHYTAGGSVKTGLREAGYKGAFETYVWSSFLLWGADHFVAARSSHKAQALADHITRARRVCPKGRIHVMGLSAGTALVVSALERLPEDVEVDTVVLFESSVSAERNLLPALRHVRGRLYATCSRGDVILAALPVNADGGSGPPAGRTGFRVPHGLTPAQRAAYAKVVNIPWKPNYVAFGWNGGHVPSTSSEFVRCVIAPRVLSPEPFPLDRPLGSAAAESDTDRDEG
jgi:pimeloyl-ACP methyl ester carboxylesterase